MGTFLTFRTSSRMRKRPLVSVNEYDEGSLTQRSYYRNPEGDSAAPARKISSVTDTRSVAPPPPPRLERVATTKSARLVALPKLLLFRRRTSA